MKIIIVEGPDNCGKSTLIHSIVDSYDCVKVIHCHKPDNPGEDPLSQMRDTFYQHADSIIDDYKKQSLDVIVFNRYYLGEWVYGQSYRRETPREIFPLISSLERYLLNGVSHEDIYYIQLMSSSVELLRKNDDGLSLSKAEQGMIQKEISLFEEAFSFSILKKKVIFINDGDNYRARQDILTEVQSFLS